MNDTTATPSIEDTAPAQPGTLVPATKKERREARRLLALAKFEEQIAPIRAQARRAAFNNGKLTPFVRQFLSKEELELVLEARRVRRQHPTVRKLRKFLGIESGRQWRKFRKAQQRKGLPVEAYVGQAIVNRARVKEAMEAQAADISAKLVGEDRLHADIAAAAAALAKKVQA